MFKQRLLIILGTLMLGWALYVIWSNKNRNIALPPADVQYRSFAEMGRDSGRGNLIGIQPYMLPVDYSSEEAFFQKLNGYFAEARRKGWLNRKSIVVLPENIGLWLVIVGEKREVYAAPKLQDAIHTLTYSNFFTYLSTRLQAPQELKDPTSYSLLAMKAADMANIYQQTFSHLASTYDVTIVAGTTVLPEPAIKEQKLAYESGALYSVSGVFLPDGSLAGLVKKAYLSKQEQTYITPGTIQDVPVVYTPAGKLGVLIHQDSWFPQAYANLREKGACMLAVPANITLNNYLRLPWEGYQNYPTPAEARADVNKLTEAEAWDKYSFPRRAPEEASITKAIGVFLKGELWELGAEGQPLLLQGATYKKGQTTPGASLSCIWL
ncbi:nitrilase-related carbon-nitrogen hydrolase [Siphonobacter sp.]|uniref:nitrilase-related carbon-nitrogen hydrolase n=1 Tax=Siphonobacter sp. TaxID=1869184 RepID=UPI003B3BB416